MRLFCAVSSVFVLLLGISSPGALAQSIILTAPLDPLTVHEGDDFASRELGNPWDFNERRDVGYEENFVGRSISVADGVWTGVNESTGGYLFPLFGGYQGALHAEGLSGERELPRFGIKHPVDASRYTHLSFRMSHSQPSSYAVYWKNDPASSFWPDGSQMRANFDGFYLDRPYSNSGYSIYSFDLLRTPFEVSRGSWEGEILAIRLDPSLFGPSGETTRLDWLRLVDPDSAKTILIRWNSQELQTNNLITVWIDEDSSGYDGTPLARYRHDNAQEQPGEPPLPFTSPTVHYSRGVHQLQTAILPPGKYYFYLTVHSSEGGVLVEKARSNYSAELTINAAPSVFFTAPTQVTGKDYALVEAANPWDMTDSADVVNLPDSGVPYPLRQFSQADFVGGVLQAVADPPLVEIGNTESDVQIHLNVPLFKPIDTSRYRYLTYRIGADETHFPSIADKVRNGWVARPVFWNHELFLDGGSSKAHILYEGTKTYTIDLWNNSIIERGASWKASPFVSTLRIDPLETTRSTWFFIDWVKLTTENYPEHNHISLSWVVEDRDNSSFSASLYYDTDGEGFDGELIASFDSLGSGSHSYSWDVSGFAEGKYYVYVEVSDSRNISQVYAPVPVVLKAPENPFLRAKVPYDYDGDAISDHVVYRAAVGQFFTKCSTLPPSSKSWGGSTSQAVDGDFDGDKKSDYAIVFENAGVLEWFVLLSHDGSLFHRTWGIAGDVSVVADYDGDGRDDIALFRDGIWYVLYIDGRVSIIPWGVAGDIPVPGDYDGDLRADTAIWRPNDGMWWVLYSGDIPGQNAEDYTAVQWGLPGDIVVPGDYDADRKTDFAVWRPTDGTWYIRNSETDAATAWQWGLPGDIPIVGDFSGDGLLDFTVWRPAVAYWYHNDRRGGITTVQWGLPDDQIPRARKELP